MKHTFTGGHTKVGLLAPYNTYPPKTGGKKFVALFHQYLMKELPVHFISVKNNEVPPEMADSFHTILGTSKLRYANVLLFFKLKKLIRQQQLTDIIIVHPYFGWLAWMLKKATGVRLSLLSHNIEAIRFKSMGKSWWKMLWYYEKNVHKIIDHNFFVTEEDKNFAIQNYKLNPKKCFVITYGIEWKQIPTAAERKNANDELKKQYQLNDHQRILLFNGSLDYQPNIEAVEYIINNINPLLLATKNFDYKIIICGKGLPASFNELKEYADKNIIYAGFVNDINLFFKGADIFINPVITGGGIKTKLVEAIGNNLTAISCKSGAFGVSESLAPGKLEVVDDFDWKAFSLAIVNAKMSAQTEGTFFNHFYWGNIAAKAAGILTGSIVLDT
ncbi:MAG: glycosyltransferase family 4 protein [Bacteroidetes bacterium]|nr:glycosyltransferase family 4 protein [Bacteroidota bacterium]MBS1756514.1 glycosyltransferase family 4 protein [Bacteroidota bacterium]